MPAKFVKSYQSPTGTVFATLTEAQTDEIKSMLSGVTLQAPENLDTIASFIVENRDVVLSCLKQKERERVREPKARKQRTPKSATANTP